MKNSVSNIVGYKNITFRAGFCFFVLMYSFCLTQTIGAQTRRIIVDTNPELRNFGCPYDYCQIGPQPYIARDSNGNTLATFSGGLRMGGVTTECSGGSYGYGTVRADANSTCHSTSKNKITISFPKPVTGEEIRIVSKIPERVIVTESGQPPVTVDLQFDGIYQGGFARVPLSGKKITSITVASPNPVWSFAIDEVRLIERLTSSGSPPPPDYCGVATMQRPAPENHSAYGWTMHSEVSDADGLVLSDVRLNGRLMAERISIP